MLDKDKSNVPGTAAQIAPRSFPVDDVKPVRTAIWTERLNESLTKRLHRKVLLVPNSNRAVANSPRCHALVHAVHTAFAEHRPLRLSPDAIWLVIEQGFSHHISENAELLRHRLVRHEGTRELSETVVDLSEPNFEHAISGFSSQIRAATDPVLHETLVCDFSTTTPAIRTASEVVLLDAYSSYFTYLMFGVCGIPAITLEGSLDDWQRIRARVEVLETFGLEWWIVRLRPILDQFVLASEGHYNREFWKAIYKPKETYADKVVTGWITDLFPYLGDAPDRRRNPVFQTERQGWALPVDEGVQTAFIYKGPGVHKGSFPSGLSSVPVRLGFRGNSSSDLDLVAGFLAVEQSQTDGSLAPLISWCVAERAADKRILI